MSKTPKTPQALPEPVVPVPAHLTQLPWSVKGRGKTATYCAALPNGHGAPNMSVALVARSGAVTFVTLTEIREVDNGVARWDFTKDVAAMTPAVRAANRAAKGTSAAAYWQSDAGLKTAERIAERSNTRASESAQAETEQAPPTPQAPTPQAPTPQAPTRYGKHRRGYEVGGIHGRGGNGSTTEHGTNATSTNATHATSQADAASYCPRR